MFFNLSGAVLALFLTTATYVAATPAPIPAPEPQVTECVIGFQNACIPGLSSSELCCADNRACVFVSKFNGFVRHSLYYEAAVNLTDFYRFATEGAECFSLEWL